GGAGGLAQQAISKGGEALSKSGGLSGAAGKLMSKLGGGGGQASGWGKNRRMPVQQWVYVSVPVRDAYNGWTEYKQWPKYMHRANQVDAQINEQEARVKVTEKMWGFKRPFTAEIVDQRPDQHIKWNSTEGTKHTGVINFHELGPRLTLIEVNLDHSPSGLVEKFARGARFVKRAIRADLHRFQGWIEMKGEDELAEFEGWRGTIEGGQITKSHEDALEEEEREDQGDEQQPEGREEEEAEGTEDEEAEGAEDQGPESAQEQEPEAEYDEESDEEPEPEAAGDEEPESAGDDETDGEYEEEPEAAEEQEPEDEEEEQPQAAEDDDDEGGRPQRRQTRQRRTPSSRGQERGGTNKPPQRRRTRAQRSDEESEPRRPQRRRRPARSESGD
ncbi:MAG TPA: SRPBCC family protein, partial [Candidatus Sulfotelmatobacter sp.]|nr:SRPBCC family protein [Candidatus Sulfotelmatobacter sp.]